MNRFHVHLHVDDLAASIGFYAKLFGAQPARTESDYAKWMLEDPPLNFAISSRGARPGIDHLGIQTDDPAQLDALKARAQAADLALLDEGQTTCCYARSEKHWITDPQGIAWEHFHTLGDIPLFSQAATEGGSACCTPGSAAEATTAAGAATVAPAGGTSAQPSAGAAASPGGTASQPAAAACCAPASGAAASPAAGRGKPLGVRVSSGSNSCC